MSLTGVLQIGSRVQYDGDICSVVAFKGVNVMLRDGRGAAQLVDTTQLLTSSRFKLLDPTVNAPAAAAPTFFEELPEPQQKRARALEAHVHEARSGFRCEADALEGDSDPDPRYDPTLTSQMQRWRNKAEQLAKESDPALRLSARRLRELAAAYDTAGIWGLVDKRVIRTLRNPVDEKVGRAIRQAIDENANQSNISKESFRKIVRRRLDAEHGKDEVALPGRSRFNEILTETASGLGVFGWAHTKRSIRNRPDRPYQRLATTRAGEVVEIDAWVLDVFAVDPITFEWVQVELVAACDVQTRLANVRLVPYSTKGFDASLLLLDLLRPKRRGIGQAGHGALPPYIGVPDVVVLGDGTSPALLPESITIDNGKVFRSAVFENSCRRLGITIRRARPYRPTDKPHVERLFRTIREEALELLPGYKGPNLYRRGKAVHEGAFNFIDEIDAFLFDWSGEVYNVRRQDGLFLPGRPGLPMSPLEMYEESVARTGQIRIPVDPTLYYELLPRAWRMINHYGVEIGGLIYDHEVLNDVRGSRSSFNGQQAGKWPFQVDPGDRSEVYFRSQDGKWFAIPWVGDRAAAEPRAFAETTVAYAKKLLVERGGKAANHEELVFVVNELLDRLDRQIEAESAEERRAYAREEVERRRRHKDRSRPRSRPDESADDEVVLSSSGDVTDSDIPARNGRGGGIDLSLIKPMGIVGGGADVSPATDHTEDAEGLA